MTNLIDAANEHALYLWLKKPENQKFACEANARMLYEYCHPVSLSESVLDEALKNLGGRLAVKNAKQIEDHIAAQVAEEKAAIEQYNETLRALPIKSLRKLVTALRPRERVIELPKEFDAAKIKAMTALEMRALVTRFGSDAVTRGLNR